jgi:hypothetical protein
MCHAIYLGAHLSCDGQVKSLVSSSIHVFVSIQVQEEAGQGNGPVGAPILISTHLGGTPREDRFP